MSFTLCVVIAVERLNDEDILAAHVDQRPGLVFAVLEVPLFVFAQRSAQMPCHPLTEAPGGSECE